MKCRICHRILKREPWASLGIGPVCAKRIKAQARDNGDTDTIEPYNGGNFYIGRIHPELKTVGGICTNIQRTVYRHSPTGFNFGYGGSGPADTALNLCLMVTTPEVADTVYQDVKWKYMTAQGDRIDINRDELIEFINAAFKKRTAIELPFED